MRRSASGKTQGLSLQLSKGSMVRVWILDFRFMLLFEGSMNTDLSLNKDREVVCKFHQGKSRPSAREEEQDQAIHTDYLYVTAIVFMWVPVKALLC